MTEHLDDPQSDKQPGKTPGKQLGRGMLTIAWICGLGLLTLALGEWEKRQQNPNITPFSTEEGGVREVVLKRNNQHHYLTTGKINGREVTFLLDTGATDVVIPAQLAAKLGLKAGGRAYANTANGVVEVRATRIDHLELGTIKLRNLKASINPGMDGEGILLGMSALRHIEFTQRGDQLTLRQYPDSP